MIFKKNFNNFRKNKRNNYRKKCPNNRNNSKNNHKKKMLSKIARTLTKKILLINIRIVRKSEKDHKKRL